jgi:hypothetical protein
LITAIHSGQYLISSHLISSHLISSHLISSHLLGKLDKEIEHILRTDTGIIGLFPASEFIDIDDGNGWTPLFEAIAVGNDEFARLLLTLGADPHRGDICSLRPIYWANVFERDCVRIFEGCQNQNILTLNEREERAIRCLENEMSNVCNRMIIFDDLSDFSTKGFKVNPRGILDTQMCDNQEMIVNEIHSQTTTRMSCSIKMFLDQLSKSGVWSSSDTKLHEMRLFALKKFSSLALQCDSSPFSLQELMALYLFSSDSNIFCGVNRQLISRSPNRQWDPFIQLVSQSVMKIPQYCGEVYRGVNIQFDPKKFGIGEVLEWSVYSIATGDWKALLSPPSSSTSSSSSSLSVFRHSLIFVIHSLTGRQIGEYCAQESDAKVVFLPKTKFRVRSWIVADAIALGQANTRATAYQVTPTYLGRVAKKRESIIVELEEVSE